MPLGAGFGHSYCLLCKSRNPFSLGLEFNVDKDGEVSACFQGRPFLQGYETLLHGGIISALLDAAMTHCLFHHGVQAVTGDLHVRFVHSVPCNAFLDLRARILSSRPPLYHLNAELLCESKVMARAEAKFLIQK